MSAPAEILIAFRDLVSAAEEAGWDTIPGNSEILDKGRDTYAALKDFLSDDEEVGRLIEQQIL